MRPALAVLAAVAALAGCGEPDQPAASPDQPVQAPDRPAPAVAPVDPAVCERLARRLPGRTLMDAERLAQRRSCPLRVVEIDGRALPVTEDFSPARINVRVEDGKVAEVTGLF